MCWCGYVWLCYWGVNRLRVCPTLPPTGLICEMTRGVKPILSDVSLIVAGSLEAHPQSRPVKAWRIWGLSDSVAITSRLRPSQCVWQGRQRGFRHTHREKASLTAVRHVVWMTGGAGGRTGRQRHRLIQNQPHRQGWTDIQTGRQCRCHRHTGAQVHQLYLQSRRLCAEWKQ